MNAESICSRLRTKFGTVGLVLLFCYGIMNVAVSIVCAVHALISFIPLLLTDPNAIMSESLVKAVLDGVVNNGWGYLLAVLISAGLLVVYKKRQFCFHDIWVQRNTMKAGSFFMLLCVFISAQSVVQLTVVWMERFFGIFDIPIMEALENASVSGDSLSMFLYLCIVGPLFEEIVFRGFVLRTLQPYGRRFAILASAFLFGLYHGNILQTPFAFVVGLILGYVTLEYSLVWAVLLHTFNNLILGDTLVRVMDLLPPWIGELLFALIIWGSFLAAVIIILAKRKQVIGYFKGPKIHPLCLKSFFTSPGILIFSGVMVLNILLNIVMTVLG